MLFWTLPNAILDITSAINPKYHSKLCYHAHINSIVYIWLTSGNIFST